MNRVKRNWVSVKRGTGWGLKSYVQLKSRMGTVVETQMLAQK